MEEVVMMTMEQRIELVAKLQSNAKWSGLSALIVIACLIGQHFLLRGTQGIGAVGYVVCLVVVALLIVNQARIAWESHRLKRQLDVDIKERIRSLRRNERQDILGSRRY